MNIRPGNADQCGATPDDDGVNFALWSSVAERVELCLFDEGRKQLSLEMPECDDGVWHGFVPDCNAGQRYGFRVHGPWNPDAGLRCNPAKILIDPYARRIDGEFDWNGKVFDYVGGQSGNNGQLEACPHDNATFTPLSVVCDRSTAKTQRPNIPWAESIFYEANVRGYTMRHPDVAESDRGRFSGMRNKDVLDYIKALGITAIELMPVLAFIDEHHLAKTGLRNYWGYNTINFFAPMPRYGGNDPVAELREMTDAIHDAGLEVVLDVAYNHTGEGDSTGPVLSFRGIDNLAYYRTEPGHPCRYINDTGCGNTINADHPKVQEIILDSLRYLHSNIGFDGFRFDLATIIGRHADGFSTSHPLLTAISEDAELKSAKLVAEPWDPGPGGYQLGQFPDRWAEWNDSFRDTVRRFWRGDKAQSGTLAKRIHGSSDIFESRQRPPFASVNLITAHDGFTLSDVVSYEHRHNEANGEENRDGHQHNFSKNYGAEGASRDAAILAARHRQRLNMLTTLLFSQGTPMLLAGDEFGHSQGGNNNAYAQDNATSWLDWSAIERDPRFLDETRELIWLRRETRLLRLQDYVHEGSDFSSKGTRFEWFNSDGEHKSNDEWANSRAFSVMIAENGSAAVLIINGQEHPVEMRVPSIANDWRLVFSSAENPVYETDSRTILLDPLSVAILLAD
jgi:glycogen operon protein